MEEKVRLLNLIGPQFKIHGKRMLRSPPPTGPSNNLTVAPSQLPIALNPKKPC